MEPSKRNWLVAVFALGLGVALGWFANSGRDEWVINGRFRMNKRTGETWRLSEGRWNPVPIRNAEAILADPNALTPEEMRKIYHGGPGSGPMGQPEIRKLLGDKRYEIHFDNNGKRRTELTYQEVQILLGTEPGRAQSPGE